MRVRDVMSRASVTDSPSDSLRAAAARMWGQQTGSLLVMEGDELLGIVTERDLMKAVARGADLDATPVSAVMTRQVLTVSPDSSLRDAASHMASRWIRHLPVVVDGRVAGMVSQRDLCGVLATLAPAADEAPPQDDLVRDRRLARVADDGAEPLLPDRTSDERDVGWGDAQPEPDDDVRRLLADRPPHHDRD